MSANEFDCLTNTLLQAGLRNNLSAAFYIPGHARKLLELAKLDVKDIRSVVVHQCPQPKGLIHYRIEVYALRGLVKIETFQNSGLGNDHDHDTYTLYDRYRDGPLRHLHLMH